MQFTTPATIAPSTWQIDPCERMLFVGSCFADNIGKRFKEEKFRAMVNPFGVMYNPVSVLHTVKRLSDAGQLPFSTDQPGTAVFTLGTNHVYRLIATGEIVDNCQKRPQKLFHEEQLTVSQCADALSEAIRLIRSSFPLTRFLLTVSPIRYRKYGYHGSQLSKATLLLAVDQVIKTFDDPTVAYFPSYEIVNDELRDYRFYQEDMLHPTDQAVSYIYVGHRQGVPADSAFYIQLNDKLATIDDIRNFVEEERANMSSEDQARMTVSIKADRDVPMGIISDIKQALQGAYALKINYSTTEKPRN